MPILKALIAAFAFGVSAPLAKLLLAVVPPLLLAGLLYLGAGMFLGLARLIWRRRPTAGRPLTRRDRWILAGVVLTGGILAPPLLLWGLARSPAASTALLLNLEVVFTALLAGLVALVLAVRDAGGQRRGSDEQREKRAKGTHGRSSAATVVPETRSGQPSPEPHNPSGLQRSPG